MSSTEYPPLFQACEPRADVLDGTLQEDQFAASLATVAHASDDAAPVYRDATQFFDMTYPTDGLRTLLSNLTGRFLAADGRDSGGYSSSILCLDTRFGGGKTHDLIASYHLAQNPTDIEDLDRHLVADTEGLGDAYLDAVGDGLSVDTSVFVGGHVDALNARSDRTDPDAPNTNTMWGEIAYQLYGLEGYEYLKEYDQNRNAPGGNTLKGLFEIGDGPALILIDEIAAYLEAASAVEAVEATLASQTLSFVLSLLETASEVEEVTVVYSIADTAFAEEAEEVRTLIDELNQIGRRQHKTITPTAESEVGQVLQHRLFEEIDRAAAASVSESYFQYYADSERQFPQEATDAKFVERLEREYPFHPTIVDTLTEKIDTIPEFQRTRGALKLLARAVYYLWNHRPSHYERHWIRLHDLTPADNAPDGSIDSTLRETLFEFVDLSAAVSADIYSEDGTAHAQLEDNRYQDRLPTQRELSSRIFDTVGGALDVDEDHARAIAKERVLEACTLVAAYGEHYDGYIDLFESGLDEYDVDPFEAKEDEKLKYLLYPENEATWLTYSRNDRLNALDDLSKAGWRVVRDVLAESTPVDALIHRNTRDTLRKYEKVGLLDTTVPDRDPKQRQIELTDETRAVYDRIDDYTRKFYKLAQQSSEAETRAIGFVMTTYRQRLTSSIYAISQSLQNRLETLRRQRTILEGKRRAADQDAGTTEQALLESLSEYDLDDFEALDEIDGDIEEADLAEVIPSVTDEGLDLLEQEIEALESFVSELTRIDRDPKIDQLTTDLDMLDQEGHNRIIVFTQYTDTMDFIRDRLTSIHGATVATYSGRGGEMYSRDDDTWTTVGKERVKREFADDDGQVDILICTDSASEGLNLQECGALINYDLPWNPMRVEQRIGRVDRIGQRYDEVTILNYSYKDTVETDIYERLDARIGLFENVVGEMQPILSGVSRQIRDATLKSDRDESRAVVAEADEEISQRIAEQERDDRVDVGESLDDVDSLVPQEIIDEARLDAWRSYAHPDLGDDKEEDYAYEPAFYRESLKTVFTESTNLADAGVKLARIDEIDLDLTGLGYSDVERYAADTYRVSVDESEISLPAQVEGETLASDVAPGEGEFLVTFSPECADDFPSVEYLAPGNPLLSEFVQLMHDQSEETARLSRLSSFRPEADSRPVVCGWGRDGSLVRITPDGGCEAGIESDEIGSWRDEFLSNLSRDDG